MYKLKYKDLMLNATRENRKKDESVYYESHHIVPDFLFKDRKRTGPKGHLEGNPNDSSNIVLLTFQEHLMAHYFLYEIYKNTRYGYSAGSALQFFFIKATGNHERQRHLSEVDERFLNEMAHLRTIGLKSISDARKGKMPAVDAITRKSIGSVPVDHPKVISGEWIHHCKGKPGKKQKPGSGVGSDNKNYREMTEERKDRVMKCVSASVTHNHLIRKLFVECLKQEFTEFKKISYVWITNHFGSIKNLIDIYNEKFNTNVEYSSYYRSSEQRELVRKYSSNRCWVTDGTHNKRINLDHLSKFLKENPIYKNGRTINAKN